MYKEIKTRHSLSARPTEDLKSHFYLFFFQMPIIAITRTFITISNVCEVPAKKIKAGVTFP